MSASVPSDRNRKLLSEAIVVEINSWPEVDRQVFIYTHYAGKRPKEIADSLGLNVVGVYRILQQRERELRTALRAFRHGTLQQPDPELYPIAVALEKCLG